MIENHDPIRQRGRRRHAAGSGRDRGPRPPAGSISASRACTTRVRPPTTSRLGHGRAPPRRAQRAVAGLRELAAQVGARGPRVMSDTAPTPPEATAAAPPEPPPAPAGPAARPPRPSRPPRRRRRRPAPPEPPKAAPPEPPPAPPAPPEAADAPACSRAAAGRASDDGPEAGRPGTSRGIRRRTPRARANHERRQARSARHATRGRRMSVPAPATTRRRRTGSSDDGPSERPEPPADPAPAASTTPRPTSCARASLEPPAAAATTSARTAARAGGPHRCPSHGRPDVIPQGQPQGDRCRRA